jgi:hypothetical protein
LLAEIQDDEARTDRLGEEMKKHALRSLSSVAGLRVVYRTARRRSLLKEKRTRTGERGKYRDALQSTKSDPRFKDERQEGGGRRGGNRRGIILTGEREEQQPKESSNEEGDFDANS